jgi:hypothetical protein
MADYDRDTRDAAPDTGAEQGRIDAIVAKVPSGAFAVAGVATASVVAMWFAFYFLVYLPRGAVQ